MKKAKVQVSQAKQAKPLLATRAFNWKRQAKQANPSVKLFKYKHVFWKRRLIKKRKKSEAKQKKQKKKTREIMAEKDRRLMKKGHNSLLKTIIRKHVCKN